MDFLFTLAGACTRGCTHNRYPHGRRVRASPFNRIYALYPSIVFGEAWLRWSTWCFIGSRRCDLRDFLARVARCELDVGRDGSTAESHRLPFPQEARATAAATALRRRFRNPASHQAGDDMPVGRYPRAASSRTVTTDRMGTQPSSLPRSAARHIQA